MPTDASEPLIEVLVVDDDAAIRELILAYFNDSGMSAVGADDGPRAVQALQRSRGRYNLVVTDLNLPGADGFAVLQAARHVNPSCDVIIITGYASIDSAIKGLQVGANDYLTKPFSLAQLDLVIKRITDRAVLEQENRRLSLLASAPPAAPAPACCRVERRVAAIEATLRRIESQLQSPDRSTPGRPGNVGGPRILTLSPRPSNR